MFDLLAQHSRCSLSVNHVSVLPLPLWLLLMCREVIHSHSFVFCLWKFPISTVGWAESSGLFCVLWGDTLTLFLGVWHILNFVFALVKATSVKNIEYFLNSLCLGSFKSLHSLSVLWGIDGTTHGRPDNTVPFYSLKTGNYNFGHVVQFVFISLKSSAKSCDPFSSVKKVKQIL